VRWTDSATNDPTIALVQGDAEEFVLTLAGNGLADTNTLFSPDGSRIAWGNIDGTVSVLDIERIRSRLAKFGLAWRSPPSSWTSE
jgi:hypothetical protein